MELIIELNTISNLFIKNGDLKHWHLKETLTLNGMVHFLYTRNNTPYDHTNESEKKVIITPEKEFAIIIPTLIRKIHKKNPNPYKYFQITNSENKIGKIICKKKRS